MSEQPPIRPADAAPPPPPTMPPAPPSHFPPAMPPGNPPSSTVPKALLIGGGCFAALLIFGFIAFLILLPAIAGAREAGHRTRSMAQMRVIGMAMLTHEGHTFPGRAILDENGKPLLSWRVALLPYLEQQALYDEFHLDEPWDSPHNRPLADRIPADYQSPGVEEQSLTFYQVPVGPGTLFEGYEEVAIKEGLANTIILVEADEGVPWTKPVDWAYKPSHPTEGVGGLRRKGFCALFADGHHSFITEEEAKSLPSLITHAGDDN